MNKRTILRLCLPRTAARATRVHPLLLARALLRRPGRQGQVRAFRHERRTVQGQFDEGLEVPRVQHIEHVEYIEYGSGFELADEATGDVPLQASVIEMARESNNDLQAK